MIQETRRQQIGQTNKIKTTSSLKRREETRTKIELGGLVHKSQLSQILGITLGDDVHGNPNNWEKEAIMLGALIEIREMLLGKKAEDLKARFKKQGELSLKYNALKIDTDRLCE